MLEVAVVIPTHNRSDLLRRAVASVVAQDHRVAEIIVVDDGSTEDIRAVVDAFGGAATLLRNDRNLGVQASRNAGVAYAKSDIVAFLDSDDYWRSDKIRLQLERARGASDNFCVSCGYRYEAVPAIDYSPPPSIAFSDVTVHNIIGPTSNLLMTRSLFELAGRFDPTMPACQDWELCIRILQHVPILAVPDILTYQSVDSSDRITASKARVLLGHRMLYERVRHTVAFEAMHPAKRVFLRCKQIYAMSKRG